ncbi:TPA: phosphoribosylformimino-5-aminoimidazole carboxamide ribotide isomerase [Candidatus Sumerlaeota bacterium]|jgi:phosphoribosylformimino-5-aminoimidazole carboxamide ribotide isomerase|nr:phosphoribosylformimino-5-aminoimidazole carboxamide ribotide isomerase [Candidatus Sumerlaeota bacterium]
MFRPCIDLHQGKVKQIVGGTLCDGAAPITNFETSRSAADFARLFKADGLRGGHVIMLGPGNEIAAHEALDAYPGGLQIGGGITPTNAPEWLATGASHVIVTSWVFREGRVDWQRLDELICVVPRTRLVLDLSCRKRSDGKYYVVTDRWQRFTETQVNSETLLLLGKYADEFLVHAVDVEGKQQGMDTELVTLLAADSPIPTTYAGGVRSIEDMRSFYRLTRGRLGFTIGSALDIYGGPLSYTEVVRAARDIDALSK